MSKWKHSILIDLCMMPIVLMFLFPFYYMIINTFKTQTDAAFNPFGFPETFVFGNYASVFEQINVIRGLSNSTVITAVSVTLVVLFGAMAAYAIVYNPIKVNKFFMFYLLLGFLIPFQAIVIPVYQTMNNLGLLNSLSGIIFFYSSNCAFSFFLTMGYMRTVPKELHEAAIVDGASIHKIFWRVVLPLCVPILATSAIFMAIQIWNDFLSQNLFLNSSTKRTLVLAIYEAKGEFRIDWPMFMTTATVTLIPILIFYLFMQRYIMRGLVAGAVKA